MRKQVEEKLSQKKLVAADLIADRYEILEKLGEGAMGVVYKGRHRELGRLYAIKVLNAKLDGAPESLERFKREGKIAASMDHVNVTTVYDCGETSDGQPFLVMDLVNGQTLEQTIRRFTRLSADVAVPVFIQICKGLAHAHSKGIIHRDLKPGNIMLINDGPVTTVKLMDFGIAKFSDAESGALTATGEVFGSVLYMSPEQCSGQRLDARTDIYSLGCLMYETLAGKPPLRGENPVQTIYKHMNEMPKSLSDAGASVPKDLEDIIARAMAKDPDRRFQSAEHLAAALESLIGSAPAPAHAKLPVEQDATVRAEAAPPVSASPASRAGGSGNGRFAGDGSPAVGKSLTFIVCLLLVCMAAAGFLMWRSSLDAGAPQTVEVQQPPSTASEVSTSANERPWIYAKEENGLEIRSNPEAAGKPPMVVVYAHQSADQGRSEDNDFIHMGHVGVNVAEKSSGAVLVLAGYSPKIWQIKLAPGVKLDKVILTGLFQQSVKGLPDDVPVISSCDRVPPGPDDPPDYYREAKSPPFPNVTINLSTEENCLANSYFGQMRAELKRLAGRDISTFIYADKAPREIDL